MNLKFHINESKPTFVGMKLDSESILKIKQYQKLINLDEPHDDFHVTVAYDKSGNLENYEPNLDFPYRASIKGLALYGPLENCLVLELDCPALQSHWDVLMATYKFSFDYKKYSPHITLSYNFNGDLNSLIHPSIIGSIYLNKEYKQDIKSDYGNSKIIKEEIDFRVANVPQNLKTLFNRYNKNGYMFLRYTNKPERGAGINPKYNYDTPLGSYAYPFNPTFIDKFLKKNSEVDFASEMDGMVIFLWNPLNTEKRTIVLDKSGEAIGYNIQQFDSDMLKIQNYIELALKSDEDNKKYNGFYWVEEESEKLKQFYFKPAVGGKINSIYLHNDKINVYCTNSISFTTNVAFLDGVLNNAKYKEITEEEYQESLKYLDNIYNNRQNKWTIEDYITEINDARNSSRKNTLFNKIYNITRKLPVPGLNNKNKFSEWTYWMSKVLGISCILDINGSETIHSNEPYQAVFFEPHKVQNIYSGENLIKKYQEQINHLEPDIPSEVDDYYAEIKNDSSLLSIFKNHQESKNFEKFLNKLKNICENKGYYFYFDNALSNKIITLSKKEISFSLKIPFRITAGPSIIMNEINIISNDKIYESYKFLLKILLNIFKYIASKEEKFLKHLAKEYVSTPTYNLPEDEKYHYLKLDYIKLIYKIYNQYVDEFYHDEKIVPIDVKGDK